VVKLKAAGLLVLLAFLLSGCALASQVEDQAYVLIMGLDRSDDGQLEMSVKIPKISGGTEQTGASGSSENYMQLSVKADDFEGALEKLDWASPRNVNLAQMKLIVISRELASSEDAPDLIAGIAQTERLFTATKVAVCEDEAKAFVEAIRPYIGTRISTDIEAMFDHYNDRGYVPESSLADLYYQTESVYSDPMVTFALLDRKALDKQKEKNTKQTSAFDQNIQQLSASYESEIPNRYLGAAVFSGGRMQCVLSDGQTLLVNLLRNELDSFRYECNGQSLEFVPTRQVYMKVDTDSNPARITINAKLSYAAQEETPDETVLKRQLTNEIQNVIAYAQRRGVEPFGFAERAARNFLTIDKWIEFDWKKQFRNADVNVELHLAQSDA